MNIYKKIDTLLSQDFTPFSPQKSKISIQLIKIIKLI